MKISQLATEEVLAALATLTFLFLQTSTASGQNRSGSPSVQRGSVKLSVVDKQDIRFTRIPVNAVAIPASTFSITQDKYGFLWFGTFDGLLRHDGYNVRTYKHEPDRPGSLIQTAVRSVYRDRSGLLWIATASGLDKMDPEHDTFTHYRNDGTNEQSLSSNDVRCVFQGSDGALWIGTGAGLDRLDPTTGKFMQRLHRPPPQRTLPRRNRSQTTASDATRLAVQFSDS